MRGAWIVVGACLVVGTVLAIALQSRFTRSLPETQDVMTGLIYYMEDHGGEFPPSEKAFLSSSFIELAPEGGLRVLAKAGTKFRSTTNRVLIRDLAPFKIAWGADLGKLRVNEYGRVLNDEGNPVELVRWPDSPQSAKSYSAWLVSIHQGLKQATTQPSPP